MRRSKTSRRVLLLAGFVAALLGRPAAAQQTAKISAAATFSILGDLVQQVGGDRVDVVTLVGPDGDVHVYSPTPSDAKKLAAAKTVFVNGLGLEGWVTRLVRASGTRAPVVTVSNGIAARKMEDENEPGRLIIDPHAWQSVANAKIYIANIRDGLAAIDPTGKASYDANAAAYLGKLDQLEKEVRAAIASIPPDRRRVITIHDSLGYFGDAYGLKFISPERVSTDSEASAKDVAKIIAQIRREKIPAVFLENITDPRLMNEIARETGAAVGGTLYSDALSPAGRPAANYIEMMRHNVRELTKALAG